MTTSISGADVTRLRELGSAVRSGSEILAQVRGRLDAVVAQVAWTGPDRERFAQDWTARFSPALASVVTALDAAAGAADGNAEQQDAASSSGAGAGTGAGVGTGPASATTGGGAGQPVPAGAAQVGQDTPGAADRYGSPTGELSARYESRGDVGTVSTGRGDPGGVSYGTYQLSTTRVTAEDFVTWSREHYPQAHERLDGLTPGTAAFGTAWRELATADATAFGAAQHTFIQTQHHEPGVDRISARVPAFTLEGRSEVVADVVWSTAVQHGPGGAGSVFANALRGQDVAAMSDADLVRAVYAERGRDDGAAWFSGSAPRNRANIVDRFEREQADALARLGQ